MRKTCLFNNLFFTKRSLALNKSFYQIITFGYGNDKDHMSRLVDGLKLYDVKALIDTRDAPNSTRPQWKKRTLENAFAEYSRVDSGVFDCRYEHHSGLGNRSIQGVRELPWSRPSNANHGILFASGELIAGRSIALMCCEGEPFCKSEDNGNMGLFEKDSYVLDGMYLKDPNCHRVEVAACVASYVHKATSKSISIVHLRPAKRKIIVSRLEDGQWTHFTEDNG